MDRRDKLGWLFLLIGIGVSIGAITLVHIFAREEFRPKDLVQFSSPIIYIWVAVAFLLGAIFQRVRVLVLRSFDDERDDFLVSYVRDICAQYGRVEAIRQPYRLQHTSIPLPGELGGITAKDEHWKKVASKLIQKSRLIVIDLSNGSENVQWELEQVKSIAPDRCIALMDEKTAQTAKIEDWLKDRTIIYSKGAPKELQMRLIDRLKKLFPPPKKADAAWEKILSKPSNETNQFEQSLDISLCSRFAPLILAASLGLWLTIVYCVTITTSKVIQQSGALLPIAHAAMLWIGVVGLFLPRKLLTRADLWSVFGAMGLKSVRHCRLIAGFFLIANIFVAVMFLAVGD